MIKRRTAGRAAIAVVSLVAGSVWTVQQLHAESGPDLAAYTPLQLADAVLFGGGPVAEALPSITPSSAPSGGKIRKLETAVLDRLQTDDPTAIQEFYDAVASGVRPTISVELADLSVAASSALQEELASASSSTLAAVRPQAVIPIVAGVAAIVAAATIAVVVNLTYAAVSYSVTVGGSGSGSGSGTSRTTCGTSRPCRVATGGMYEQTANELRADALADAFG